MVLLYLTFLQVPISSLMATAGGGRFLLTLLVVNFVVVPLVVAAMVPFLPGITDIRLGVLLVLLCPCIDYVVTFSALAGGDHRRLLAATPIMLVVQMLLLPVYLRIFLGDGAGDVIDVGPFITAFVTIIVVPLALAWVTQVSAARFSAARSCAQEASRWMVPAMMAVLGVVVASQLPLVTGHLGEVAAVVPFYLVFLVVMAPVGIVVSRFARLDRPQTIAATFSGATRNSLVVLPLALAIPGPTPLAAAAVVTQTIVEVIAMVFYVRLIPRLTAVGRGSR